jgi:hypothetical protein
MFCAECELSGQQGKRLTGLAARRRQRRPTDPSGLRGIATGHEVSRDGGHHRRSVPSASLHQQNSRRCRKSALSRCLQSGSLVRVQQGPQPLSFSSSKLALPARDRRASLPRCRRRRRPYGGSKAEQQFIRRNPAADRAQRHAERHRASASGESSASGARCAIPSVMTFELLRLRHATRPPPPRRRHPPPKSVTSDERRFASSRVHRVPRENDAYQQR